MHPDGEADKSSVQSVGAATTTPTAPPQVLEEQPSAGKVEDAALMKETSENGIQDVVDKTQASKAGQIPALDANPPANGMHNGFILR